MFQKNQIKCFKRIKLNVSEESNEDQVHKKFKWIQF